MTAREIISENKRRRKIKFAPFDPLTGEGSVGERFLLKISDFAFPKQYLPIALRSNALIQQLIKYGSFEKLLHALGSTEDSYEEDRDVLIKRYIKTRCKEDFPFWAAMFATIKGKEGGEDVKLRLNRSQRRLVERFEHMRLAGKPIRLILLKARQWGGSTCVQMYMAWIMLMHHKGWNSLIVSHVMQSTTEVKGMFTKLMDHYPLWMLYDTSVYNDKERSLRPFEGSQSIDIVPQRGSKIKVGTAESPESARGGDSAMVHCTEVAFWKKTDNKTPEQIIRSACSGVLLAPLTMIVYESTANGVGDFFNREWNRAKEGESLMEPLFISWYDIEMYELEIDNPKEFAKQLWDNRNNEANNGQYNWWLWNRGATLEAINWYIHKRKDYTDHADMAAEYPSDDIEAFKTSGQIVLNPYALERLRANCKEPSYIGELAAIEAKGKKALMELTFHANDGGCLKIWDMPEIDINVRNRYLAVVDVGGRSIKADYSIILILDRYWMMYGDKPCVAAQWRGHIRHDLLAWKAAQLAAYYNNALLVFESNTLESKDKERDTDGGSHIAYILDEVAAVYNNLYLRESPPENVIDSTPRKIGFHTNVSTKVAIIDHLVSMVEDNGYIERDTTTIDEYAVYEKKQNGSFGAKSGYHDDCLMTRAIGLYISTYKMDLPKLVEMNSNAITHTKNLGLISTF